MNKAKYLVLGISIIFFFFGVNAYDWSVTNTTYVHNNIEMHTNRNVLTNGSKVRFWITSRYNNLGAVIVRFESLYRPKSKEEERVLFTLFGPDGNSILYRNTYRIAYGFGNPLYPFGFSIIPESKGKKYMVTLEFINGTLDDPLRLSLRDPVVLTRYSTPKTEILLKPLQAMNFAIRKYVIPFGNPDYQYFVWLSVLPVLFFYQAKTIKNTRNISVVIPLFLLLGSSMWDIIFMQMGSDAIFLWYCYCLLVGTALALFTQRQIEWLALWFLVFGFINATTGNMEGSRNALVYSFLTVICVFFAMFISHITHISGIFITRLGIRKKI